MSEAKTLTVYRYDNRKHYIKELHRYTTLKEIRELWLAGNKITIFRYASPHIDITQETIVDALTTDVESKKKIYNFMCTFLTQGSL